MSKNENWVEMSSEHKKSREDIVIDAKLKMIETLSKEIENSDDQVIIQEIINTCYDIINIQKDMIDTLSYKIQEVSAIAGIGQDYNNSIEEFANDEQIRSAFTAYLNYGAKKQLSSYTVNDYCSRIKNLWKTFYDDYTNKGDVRDKLSVTLPDVIWDEILMNAYENIEALKEYVEIKIFENEGNRNWANTRAAINKFDEFKASLTKKKTE